MQIIKKNYANKNLTANKKVDQKKKSVFFKFLPAYDLARR